MRRKRYFIYTLSLLMLGLVACSEEDTFPQNESKEITPNFLTRGDADSPDMTFGSEGATMTVLSTDGTVNKTYTYRSEGWCPDDLKPIVLKDAAGVELQAYSPANAGLEQFTIPADQSAGINVADWCISEKVTLDKNSTSVDFTMTHLLCKIILKMEKTAEMNVTDVEIRSLFEEVKSDGTSVSGCSSVDITPHQIVSDDKKEITVTAIVAPGIYSATDTFMTFKLNGVPMTVTFNDEETFDKGYKYELALQVNYSKLELNRVTTFPTWGTEYSEESLTD